MRSPKVFFMVAIIFIMTFLSSQHLFAENPLNDISQLKTHNFTGFANVFIERTKHSRTSIRTLKDLYYRGRFLMLAHGKEDTQNLSPVVDKLKKLLKKSTDGIAISGTWKTNTIIGTSTLIITDNSYIEKNVGLYPWTTTGEIICYDNAAHYFIVKVKSHSEEWGQTQLNKYGRHAWAPEVTITGEINKEKIRYSGALNFFDNIEDAMNDTESTNGAADPINGKFDIYTLGL